jgi:hypothetical protein
MEYQIFKKCVMDTSDPEIVFDEDGVCNYCKSYEARKKKFTPLAEKKHLHLQAMIDSARKKGKVKSTIV